MSPAAQRVRTYLQAVRSEFDDARPDEKIEIGAVIASFLQPGGLQSMTERVQSELDEAVE